MTPALCLPPFATCAEYSVHEEWDRHYGEDQSQTNYRRTFLWLLDSGHSKLAVLSVSTPYFLL